jgi:hypothetical protein
VERRETLAEKRREHASLFHLPFFNSAVLSTSRHPLFFKQTYSTFTRKCRKKSKEKKEWILKDVRLTQSTAAFNRVSSHSKPRQASFQGPLARFAAYRPTAVLPRFLAGLFSPPDVNVSQIPALPYPATAPWVATATIKYIPCAKADPGSLTHGVGSYNFSLIDMREDAVFWLFSGGIDTPRPLVK